jgi:REP element-mobilizing transposase RayT
VLELRSFSHGYGQITYHIVLVPKYRYRIFYDRRSGRDALLSKRDKNIVNDEQRKIVELFGQGCEKYYI